MLRININDLDFDSNDVCRYKGCLFSGIALETSRDGVVMTETTYVGAVKTASRGIGMRGGSSQLRVLTTVDRPTELSENGMLTVN